MVLLQQLLIAIFPALVIVAALKDVTSFTIPNWISGVLIIAFIPAAFASGLPLSALGLHLAVGLACLVASMGMFAVGWIGGGDAKLFAAAGLWLGPAAVAPFIMVTAMAGGMLAMLLINLRRDWVRGVMPTGPGWIERLRQPKGDAPYGVAIALGALAAFPTSALFAAS
jgi:prepilin peptidase CpaA